MKRFSYKFFIILVLAIFIAIFAGEVFSKQEFYVIVKGEKREVSSAYSYENKETRNAFNYKYALYAGVLALGIGLLTVSRQELNKSKEN
jgi:glucan phosphoethanolaminetransferase (alkaline phosphatase superfamily)